MDANQESSPRKPRSTLQVSLLALLLVVLGTGLILATGPFAIVLGLGGLFFLGLLTMHYVVWGKWVSRELDAETTEGVVEPPLGPPEG